MLHVVCMSSNVFLNAHSCSGALCCHSHSADCIAALQVAAVLERRQLQHVLANAMPQLRAAALGGTLSDPSALHRFWGLPQPQTAPSDHISPHHLASTMPSTSGAGTDQQARSQSASAASATVPDFPAQLLPVSTIAAGGMPGIPAQVRHRPFSAASQVTTPAVLAQQSTMLHGQPLIQPSLQQQAFPLQQQAFSLPQQQFPLHQQPFSLHPQQQQQQFPMQYHQLPMQQQQQQQYPSHADMSQLQALMHGCPSTVALVNDFEPVLRLAESLAKSKLQNQNVREFVSWLYSSMFRIYSDERSREHMLHSLVRRASTFEHSSSSVSSTAKSTESSTTASPSGSQSQASSATTSGAASPSGAVQGSQGKAGASMASSAQHRGGASGRPAAPDALAPAGLLMQLVHQHHEAAPTALALVLQQIQQQHVQVIIVVQVYVQLGYTSSHNKR